MKYLNEILINWNQQEDNSEGIIDVKNVSDEIIKMDFDEWIAKYTWYPEKMSTRISEKQLIKNFKLIYEVLEPYTEVFLWVLAEVINNMADAKHCKNLHWRARLNCSVWLLLFNKFPTRFNTDKSHWILASFYSTLKSLPSKTSNILNIIRKKAEEKSDDIVIPPDRNLIRSEYNKLEDWNLSTFVYFKIINPIKTFID